MSISYARFWIEGGPVPQALAALGAKYLGRSTHPLFSWYAASLAINSSYSVVCTIDGSLVRPGGAISGERSRPLVDAPVKC